MKLIEKITQGDILSAAKLMRRLENDEPEAIDELKELYRHTGNAYIVSVSGAPGAGKSTLLANLIGAFRKKRYSVGVVAVDPTSPLSGGAILGDRLRMQKHGEDKDVFIRSLASRGWKGGLSKAVMNTIHVMDSMGKDVIFVEAVGSGQGETDFARLADTSILVLVSGMGDEIQVIKAGIMEVADILVVNKADRVGAAAFATTVTTMLDTSPNIDGKWKPPVILTDALQDKGTSKLVKEILRHRTFLKITGQIEQRRLHRAEFELISAVEQVLRNKLSSLDNGRLEKLVLELAAGNVDPVSAAEKLLRVPRVKRKVN